MWRQLTSMRTALFLLLLVAVGAIPGSIFPQRSIDPERVETYVQENSSTAPWLDRLGLFDVYSSPWFSAMYLLLLLSLVGCIVPRTRLHWHALRSAPPRAPRRLDRLPVHTEIVVAGTPEEVSDRAYRLLRRRRYRMRRPGDAGRHDETGRPDAAYVVSGETGYLRETGNLLFHIAIVVVILAVAWGHLVGWRGDRIVPVGQSFVNSASGYDTFSAGPWVDEQALRPFTVRVDQLDVEFEERTGGAQFGAPRFFRGQTTVWDRPEAAPQSRSLGVNDPLQFGGASVYLLGNGYAPVVTVRDAAGKVLYRQATPFLPEDNNYRSTGSIKVTAASPTQLGFTGLFLPSSYLSDDGPASSFPALKRPALVLTGFEGELFPDGRPQSVYTLDTSRMTRLSDSNGQPLRLWLEPGKTVQLPGGRGSITLESVDRWAGVSTRYDPARPLALGASLLALAGLVASLLVRRRRVFVRVVPAPPQAGENASQPRTVVRIGALARGEDALLPDWVEGFARELDTSAPAGAGRRRLSWGQSREEPGPE